MGWELVSSLTRDGMLCKKLDGKEQALFEALAVRDASYRHGLNASAMLGSGSTWVHCVRMGDAAAAANQDARRTPVMLCNDDTMGWAEGLRRLTLAGAQRVDKRPRRIRH